MSTVTFPVPDSLSTRKRGVFSKEIHHDGNFGHRLIYRDLSQRPFTHILGTAPADLEAQSGGQMNMEDMEDRIRNGLIEKVNDRQFLRITRHFIDQIKHCIKLDEPTLVLSIFMPNTKLANLNLDTKDHGWVFRQIRWELFRQKYIGYQIRAIISFKYFFPNGNIRVYFDRVLLNSLKQQNIPENGHQPLYQCSSIQEDHTADFEDFKLMAKDFVSHMESVTRIKRPATLYGEMMLTYETAARFAWSSGNVYIREYSGEFFAYEFGPPFREQRGDFSGHITDGYIGQMIRYIVLTQTSYTIGKIYQERLRHLVWRDGHSNSVSTIDAMYIYHFNQACRLKGTSMCLLPDSYEYQGQYWHDACIKKNGKADFCAPIAGQIQMTNFTSTPEFVPELILVQSICLPFILDHLNRLPLLEYRDRLTISRRMIIAERPNHMYYHDNHERHLGYGYGIDEFVLATLCFLPYYRDRSIHLNFMFTTSVIPEKHAPIDWEDDAPAAFHIMMQMFSFTTYVGSFDDVRKRILAIESLRNSSSPDFTVMVQQLSTHYQQPMEVIADCLDILLRIIPNKYQITGFIYNEDRSAREFLPLQTIIPFAEIKAFIDKKRDMYTVSGFYDVFVPEVLRVPEDVHRITHYNEMQIEDL